MSPFSYDTAVEWLKEGKVLITVNSRLRDKLAWHYANQNKAVWVKPQIYTLEEKITALWRFFELHFSSVPILLSKEQERVLWTKIIQDHYPEGFIQLSKMAGLAMQAWRTVHLWDMPNYFEADQAYFQGSEDAKKFSAWAKLFQAELKQHHAITAAQRIGYVLTYPEKLSQFRAGQLWVLIGIDDLPPIYQKMIALIQESDSTRLVIQQVDLKQPDAVSHQLSFKTVLEEFEAAASWATALVEKGIKNIGIVHPELAQHRATVENVFLEAFHPEQVYCAQKMVSPKFSLSAGTPLGSQTLVKIALKILVIISQNNYNLSDIDFLLSHGYIGKNKGYLAEHLRLLQLLKKTGRTVWPIPVWLNWLSLNTDSDYILSLVKNINKLNEQLQANKIIALPYFVKIIKYYLGMFDFPGERVLSSLEYQILSRFYGAIEDFMRLDLVLSQKRYSEYLSDFEQYVNFIPFQAESGEVPVNIMGVLEGAGQLFSHLWIMGMNHHNWPASPDPNPFLPYELQREKNMPHASAEREYALSKKLTERFNYSAEKVFFSYSQQEENVACLPSECIKAIPLWESSLDGLYNNKNKNKNKLEREQLKDKQAPKVDASESISGGTSILKSQAACPFKAFSEVRLKLTAESNQKALGISAMERGILVHDILDKLWAQLKTHHVLCAYTSLELDELIDQKIKQGIDFFREKDPSRLGDKFWDNEKINLKKVLHNWLMLEKQRAPFKVLLRESWKKIKIAGLSLTVRIDRVDVTDAQETILVDYKTGEISLASCFGERLNEPQLPIYCLLEQDFSPLGVAFGLVKPTGECDFIGITYSEGVLPNVKSVDDQKNYLVKLGVDCQTKLSAHEVWKSLLSYWQHNLARLASDFMQGVAEVSPKIYPQTCRYCHLMSVCRLNEKLIN